MDLLLLITYLSIAIGVSFMCSIAEAVLLSITPSYIAQLRQDQSKRARRIVALKENVDRPLAAILSLNTIAHTVGAAGVGAQAANMYGDKYVGVFSAILTLLILVLSEIIPKTIGALHWRFLAGPVSLFIQWLILAMMPLVWLSELLTRWLAGDKRQSLVTRAEIAAVAELGTNEGLLQQTESTILRNLLRMESITVEDVMTPSTVVISLPEKAKLGEVADEVTKLPVSRIPTFRDRRDVVTGFVLRSDLLTAIAGGELEHSIDEFRREILTVDEDQGLQQVFDVLLNTRAHIALVTDKFGGMEGIITLEDVLETLLGLEIVDEQDKTVNMQQLARQRWQQRLQKQGIQIPESPINSPSESANSSASDLPANNNE